MASFSFLSPLYRLAAMCALSGLIVLSPALAQTTQPTSDQLDIFRSLTPEQQQQILQSLGRDPEALRRGQLGGSSDRLPRDMRRRPDFRDAQDDDDSDEIPRFKGQDTLLVSLEIREFKVPPGVETPKPPTTPQADPPAPQPNTQGTPANAPAPERIVRNEAEMARLQTLRTNILRRNPFQLDKWGILNVPELGPIPLGGLTAEEARERLAAEMLLADFVVGVTYLPVDPTGAQALKPFGHDLFVRAPDTFAPTTDIPVPAEYVVGPGDTFEVQLIGTVRGRYTLVVRRDGQINLPDLGPIPVGGLRFDQARAVVEQRVSERLIGSQASVQMGELRSIQVFIVGDAQYPGSYTVSGLSTITNALFVGGGVKPIGSLRKIELRRGGQTITRFDLYDLLLKGDTRADVRLMSGDVILVPPVGAVVGVSGEVRRPALYELKTETTVAELVELAGGTLAEADGRLVTVERVDVDRRRVVLDVAFDTAGKSFQVRNGDVVRVPTIRPTVEDSVKVGGHVHRPGDFQYRPNLRVSDVLTSLEELKPRADQHYVLIRREVPPTRRIEFLSVDLVAALAQRGGAEDPVLAPRDEIIVFDLETGRDRFLQPLLRDLRLQSSREAPTAEVTIGGRVNIPGAYPLESGMRVSDLIRAGGSLSEAAYGGRAELTRSATGAGEARTTELIEIDLGRAMAGDPAADFLLQPFDYLVIKELPLWSGQEYVQIEGEVRFPGSYPIQRGETMRSLVERAGGLTELAFQKGTVFTRETLRERERRQLQDLSRRLETDLAQVSLMAAQEGGGDAAEALAVGQQLLANLRSAEPVGRLVIDLGRAMNAKLGSPDDIVLKDGDRLVIPRVTQEVTVIGEVQSPTSHLHAQNLSRNEYIQLSGGTTQRADTKRTYVVRADGSVVEGSGRWFSGAGGEVQAGDTIVVPLDAERIRALPLFTAISSVVANLAISAAALAAL